MKTHTSDTKSLKKIIIFCVLVFFLIGISLTYKAVLLMQAGKFDGQHRFTLRLINGNTTEILSFDPQNREQIAIILPHTAKDALLEKSLGIAIDGTILHAEAINFHASIPSQIQQVLFRFPVLGSNITIFDALSLSFLLHTTQWDQDTRTFSSLEDEKAIDSFVSTKLRDETITQENKSIQIINATGESGIGGRLERVVVNSGGNVVAVNTGRDKKERSTITYFDTMSYTVRKLEKILGVSAQLGTNSSISDILVVVGTDVLAKPLFR